LYGRALAGNGRLYWVAGAIFAILAGCTRQNMVAVAPAVGLLVWWRPPRERLLAASAVVVPVLVGLGTHFWFERRPDIQHPLMVRPSLDRAFLIAFIIVHAGGLAIAPLIALDPRPRRSWLFLTGSLAMGASAYYWWTRGGELVFGPWFPYSTGLIGYCGPYAGLMAGSMEAWLPMSLRIALTIGGCLGGGWLIDRVFAHLSRLANPVVLFALLQFPLLLITSGINDRYMFMTLPGLLILARPLESRLQPVAARFQRAGNRNGFGRLAPALITLGIMGIISFGLMHDCLAWNSARWALGNRAVSRGIEPWRIEGGMEWNGWNYLHDPPPVFQQPSKKNLLLGFTKRYFPGVTGEQALAFASVPGLNVLDHEDYQTWLPPSRQAFCLIAPKP
jgi:hypothetical protein